MSGNGMKWVVAAAIALAFIFGAEAMAKSRTKSDKAAVAPKPKTYLCEECEGKSHTKDIGQCSECKGMTTSGEFKFCMNCANKKNACMSCGKALPKDKKVKKAKRTRIKKEKAPIPKSCLCEKCEDKSFTKDIGQCSECKAMTTSGSHKFCMGCSAKKRVCMHCGESFDKKPAEKNAGKKAVPKIDVVFVLDTTGSMSGLIEGAKRKIWSMANQMISAKPTPDIRIGLIAYRDRRDAYITKVFNLTADIDKVYSDLQGFAAGGGGDTPESVNQALHEAVTKMDWTEGDKALKLIFLVGDAPPHMDYKDDVKYQDTCKLAVTNWITINTVRCGTMPKTEEVWQDISRLADGKFVSISQSGGMVAIKTPVDKELAELGGKLARTRVFFGREEFRDAGKKKSMMAEKRIADKEDAAAERAKFNARKPASAPMEKSKSGRVIGGDLVDELNAGRLKTKDLKVMKEESLPENMRKMTLEEREKFVAKNAAERAEINKKILELSKKRDAFIREEMKKNKGAGDSFDKKVFEMLKEQGAKKGLKY